MGSPSGIRRSIYSALSATAPRSGAVQVALRSPPLPVSAISPYHPRMSQIGARQFFFLLQIRVDVNFNFALLYSHLLRLHNPFAEHIIERLGEGRRAPSSLFDE